VACRNCDLLFNSRDVYRVHLFSHHPQKSRQNVRAGDAATAASGAENSVAAEMKFQCPQCHGHYDAWLDLVAHVDDHGVRRKKKLGSQIKCRLCYKIFADEQRYDRHMASAHGRESEKPLSCHQCPKRFSNASALRGHAKVVHGDGALAALDTATYDCPICGSCFGQVASLRRHALTHRDVDGRYPCPSCGKHFAEYAQIRKHIRAHHGARRHVCGKCGKGFVSADKLRKHSVVHSAAKEFLCDDCGKQFKRKDKLREHERRMHSGRQIAMNAKRDEDMAALRQARASEAAPRFVPSVAPTDYHRFIYKCHECRLGFKRRGMLVNHLAKRHPAISPDAVPELNLPILKATKDYYCQVSETFP